MSNILTQPAAQTDAEQEAILNHLFQEMHKLNEKIKQDQAEIDQLKVETDLLRNETRAILARLEVAI